MEKTHRARGMDRGRGWGWGRGRDRDRGRVSDRDRGRGRVDMHITDFWRYSSLYISIFFKIQVGFIYSLGDGCLWTELFI